MKPTREQLNRIDFSRCELKPLNNLPLKVKSDAISVSICCAETGIEILRKEYDDKWRAQDGVFAVAVS